MSLSDEMNRLRATSPGCRALVFGDVSTRTVLRSAAEPGLRQEDHDRLLAWAGRCLGPSGRRALEATSSEGDGGAPAEMPATVRAVNLSRVGARLARRAAPDSPEVLCAACDGAADLAALDAALATLLSAHA